MTNGKKTSALAPEAAVCTPKRPPGSRVEHAKVAIENNPTNHPSSQQVAMIAQTTGGVTPEQIAVMTTKYWRTDGVDLGVGFLDNPPTELRAKILAHMNAWGDGANIRFRECADSPEVRISRGAGGYWSYLGTDIKTITDPAKPTMNLEGFTMNTADGEFYRVVRHETGHTLGCPHEHMRKELVALIDRAKAIEYYGRTEGWTEAEVIQQVLTPLDDATLWGTANPDSRSIMCYQIPGSLTTNGQPILGGLDIDQSDRDFIKLVYPQKVSSAPMTASTAVAAQAARTGAAEAPRAASAPAERAEHRHESSRRSERGEIEVRTGDGVRVLLTRPVDEEVLERVWRLLR